MNGIFVYCFPYSKDCFLSIMKVINIAASGTGIEVVPD
jgi:hypothetical protein